MRPANLKKVFTIVAFSFAMLGTAEVAQAITNGIPDENRHPYVGMFIVAVEGGYSRCSGTMLSATVMVTAAHCIRNMVDPTEVWVTLDTHLELGSRTVEEFLASESFITGTAYPHPDTCLACKPGLPPFSVYDVGVIVLDEPVNITTFAALPEAGLVDTLDMGTSMEVVGYGVQERVVGGGPPVWLGTLTRYFAFSDLIASEHGISDMILKLTANPAKGKGGSCFGDSGGPTLLAGTNIILAVHSFGTNDNCAGVKYNQRLDLPEVLAFIEGFL